MSPAEVRDRMNDTGEHLLVWCARDVLGLDQSQSTDLPTAGTFPPSPAVARRHETSPPPEAAPPPPETKPLPSRRGWSPAST